ncbi:hypothetical protein MKY84_13890 [Chryseomicrobium sp. FSL W7-1435]|uniref:hypothetical protein n=1 Tax=Chryseomicrobium sp. FSL W7-1435 TaxID=2921704 RepID=UPI00315AF3D5
MNNRKQLVANKELPVANKTKLPVNKAKSEANKTLLTHYEIKNNLLSTIVDKDFTLT